MLKSSNTASSCWDNQILFLGYELVQNYKQGWVWLYMPDYFIKVLKSWNYIQSKNPWYSSDKLPQIKPLQRGDRHISIATDDLPLLDPKGTCWVQFAIGSCLYYAKVLKNTILDTPNQL